MFFNTQPRFLYQYPTSLNLYAARIFSNSSSNIPRCDNNEPILFFFFCQRWFLKYIFRKLIHRNHQNYLTCSLFLTFYSQSLLVSGWNISLRISLAISSVIYLEEPLFSDNFIATAQPDELIDFLGNSPQFLIFLLRCTYYWGLRQIYRVFLLGRFYFERISKSVLRLLSIDRTKMVIRIAIEYHFD